MFETDLTGIAEALTALAGGFDPGALSPEGAGHVMALAVRIENVASTLKTLAAPRAAEQHGRLAQTGQQLAAQPAITAAALAGDLSPRQTTVIAKAVAADPGAARQLLSVAQAGSMTDLVRHCDRTIAAADPDAEAQHARIHGERSCSRRRCDDGAQELIYHSTPAEVAAVWSAVQGHARAVFDQARLAGRREPAAAYLADGLLALASAAQPSRDDHAQHGRSRVRRSDPTKPIVRVDWDALVRGYPIAGEQCEIAGLGPVPVTVVKDMMASGDPFLAAIATRGVNVATVAHLGRQPTAYQHTALEWTGLECTVVGCDSTARLEIDHRTAWADSKITLLGGLDPLCGHHHDLKTHRGWTLEPGTGKRAIHPPEHTGTDPPA